METMKILSLLLGILGALMLFFYGVSPNIKKGSATYIYTDEELKLKNDLDNKLEYKYQIIRVIGLVLSLCSIAISFFLS